MPGELLLDTGPLVALLDRTQRLHRECVQAFASWTDPIVTTEAVVTEATHLLGSTHAAVQCLRLVRQAGVVLSPTGVTRQDRIAQLMLAYADTPMDYADATLVALAEELHTDLVFTLDRRGFATYRWERRRTFRILP